MSNQSKTIYLILALVALIVAIIIVQITQKSTPTLPPLAPATDFRINKTNLLANQTSVVQVIEINFTKPVAGSTLTLELAPPAKYKISFDPTFRQLTIDPNPAWLYDTQYILRILKQTRSQDNQMLDQDYNYQFRTEPRLGI